MANGYGDTSMSTGLGSAPASTNGATTSTSTSAFAGTTSAPATTPTTPTLGAPTVTLPVLVLTVDEYEEAITEEIGKYFETDATISVPKEENSSLSTAEMSALTNISSTAYSYVTPNKVVTESTELEISNKTNDIWEPTKYQESYTNSVSNLSVRQGTAPVPTQNSNPINRLAALNVSIVEEPKLVVGTETTTSCYVDAEDILEESTKFKTENLFTFDTMPTLSEDIKIQAETISLSLSNVLTKGLEGETINYQEASLPMSSFDLSSTTNAIDTTLRTKTDNLEQELQTLPIQMKSLFLGRSPSVTKNWVDEPADPMADPVSAGMMQYNYCEIQEVQVLSSFSTANPTFTTLQKSNLDSIRSTGQSLVCRLQPYDITGLVPESRRTINTNTTNQYFIIKDSASRSRSGRNRNNTGPVCGTTGFANSIMQYLSALSNNMNSSQRDAMRFVNVDNNETVEPLFNQSDQFFAAPLVGLGSVLGAQQSRNQQAAGAGVNIDDFAEEAADVIETSDNPGFCASAGSISDPTSVSLLGDIEDAIAEAIAEALEDFTEETEQSEEDQEEAAERGGAAAQQDWEYQQEKAAEEKAARQAALAAAFADEDIEESTESASGLGGRAL